MNGFDFALIAVASLSTLFAFARGVVRELIALVTWVIAIVAAFMYTATVATVFSRLDVNPAAKYVFAFALIMIVVMIGGAFIARALSGVIKAIGLGFVDRMLGAVFGLLRALAVIVLFALVAGVTRMPKQDWWQNAVLGRPLAEAALSLRPYLPRAWAERLDFSRAGAISAFWGAGSVDVAPGESLTCVES